jgi:hypothetical protein
MSKYKFSHEWFNNLTAPLWEKYIVPRKAGISRYCELGVAEGQSLIWAIENFLAGNAAGLAVGVDPFLPSRGWKPTEGKQHWDAVLYNINSLYYGGPNGEQNTTPPLIWDRQPVACDVPSLPLCEIHARMSQEYLQSENREFDMIYVDGNHEAPHALFDMELSWRLLRVGGLLVVDDAERRYRGGMPSVAVALQAFEDCYHGYFDVLYRHPKQVAYLKINKRRRGQYPPTMEMVPSIRPKGPTGDDV